MGNPNYPYFTEFQSMLSCKFKTKELYDVDELAVFINRAPDTTERYISGVCRISPDMAKKIVAFVLSKNPYDTELLRFFCPKGFSIVRDEDKELTPKERQAYELSIASLTGITIDRIEKAYEDGKVTKLEFRDIKPLAEELRQRIAELAMKIEGEVK
jgi:hypothetical protein